MAYTVKGCDHLSECMEVSFQAKSFRVRFHVLCYFGQCCKSLVEVLYEPVLERFELCFWDKNLISITTTE